MLASTAVSGVVAAGEGGLKGRRPRLKCRRPSREAVVACIRNDEEREGVRVGVVSPDSTKSVGTSSAGTSSRRSKRESELEKSGKPRESTCEKRRKNEEDGGETRCHRCQR
ncbi:hypothetical protein NL676_008629 [Syzygium grande]|nr:hypothetical protein NL676_008629 [Syzygium grande]